MAMSSCVVRRAASCSSSLIALATRYARAPLANRSPGSSSFPPLLHLRLLPFSTDSPESPEFPNSKQTASGTSDKVSLEGSNKVSLMNAAEDRVSYPNIGDKIHNEIASYSNEVLPIPSRFPFDLRAPPGSTFIYMEGRYQKERIKIHAPLDIENPVNGDGPSLPMTVELRRGPFGVMAYMTAKPDQLHIRKVIMRNSDIDTETMDVSEYFKRVGITPKVISFLYDRLGYSRRNA